MACRRAVRSLTFSAVVVAATAVATPAWGHNAGHLTLPSGECHVVGSSKDAPLVGRDKTQLDLVPETSNPPFDEYGTSFVGFSGRTPISPGGCR
jgi:hypothetical protein